MRHLILAAFVALAFGCSNNGTSKNANPNGAPGDAGWDVSTANNNVSDSSNNSSNNASDAGNNRPDGSPPADVGGTMDGGPPPPPDMGLPSPCPDTAPEAATACTPVGLQCEYGDDPRESCRVRAECAGGTWMITTPRCEPLPDVICPMTREDASGADCDTMDAFCRYDDLVCHCTNCVDGPVVMCAGDPTWMCDTPNPDAECPEGKPRLGEGCRADGKTCNYKCGPDGARVCRAGAWRSADGGPCPISTAKVKRDIRYLSAAELEQISKSLQSIPLARYEYTDPSLGRGEKLGFIIEDMPASTPAVDRQRMMVDLYGYTSMLVADAQAKEKRMKSLEARLQALESQVLECRE